MYPSPGQSFLIILQPGHAGFGIDFRRRRLCDFPIAIVSIEFIWWAPFKDRIGSAGTFALAMRGSETVAARACPACHAGAGEGGLTLSPSVSTTTRIDLTTRFRF